jgi:cobalt-zinc-cadmium efflux system protein
MGAHHHHHAGSDRTAGMTALGANRGRLFLALLLSLLYMVAEVVGGLVTGSLALLADAAHMLSDSAALGLGLFAAWIARRPADSRKTYGYYRTEILAALVNGATLVAISMFIFMEAFERWREPRPVEGGTMMAIAAGGLLVNLAMLWILSKGRDESLNVRGAWLHVLTDTLGSVQAIAAGFLIWTWGWNWADPLASVLIGLLVIYSSWGLLKEVVSVLMEGAPAHIDVDEIRDAICGLAGVISVHDLHVWTITSGLESLSAHVVVGSRPAAEVLTEIRLMLRKRFGIAHQTIQIEPRGFREHRPLDCR